MFGEIAKALDHEMVISGQIGIALSEDGEFVEAANAVEITNKAVPSMATSSSRISVFNFEVEKFHNYVADGYIVHNDSLITDLSEAEKPTMAAKLAAENGQLLKLNSDGSITITQEVSEKAIQQLRVDATTGDVIKTTKYHTNEIKVVEEVNHNTGKFELVELEYFGTHVGGSFGRSFGSQLGAAFAGDNAFAQLAVGSVAATVFQNFGEFVGTSISNSLFDGTVSDRILSFNGDNPTTSEILDVSFSDFGEELLENLGNATVGAISSMLVAQVMDILGWDDELSQAIGSSIIATKLAQALEITDGAIVGSVSELANTASVEPVNPIDVPDSYETNASWGSISAIVTHVVATYLAEKIDNPLVNIDNKAEAVLVAAGSTAGAYIGASLAAPVAAAAGQAVGGFLGEALFNVIVPGVGIVVGYLLGETFGSAVYELLDGITGGFLDNLFGDVPPSYYLKFNFDTELNIVAKHGDDTEWVFDSDNAVQLVNGIHVIVDSFGLVLSQLTEAVGGYAYEVDRSGGTFDWDKIKVRKHGDDHFYELSVLDAADVELAIDAVAYKPTGYEPYGYDGTGPYAAAPVTIDQTKLFFAPAETYEIVEQVTVWGLERLAFTDGNQVFVKAFEAWLEDKDTGSRLRAFDPSALDPDNGDPDYNATFDTLIDPETGQPISTEYDPKSPAAQLSLLREYLQIAADYSRYLEDTLAINLLIASEPLSAFTAGWALTLFSAEALDLNEATSLSLDDDRDNEILAADGDDIISALGAGSDIIKTYGGHDIVTTAAGDDSILVGHGDDSVHAGAGADLIIGGPGHDQLHGETGEDTIFGGDGDDILYGGASADWIDGGSGADTIDGNAGYDTVSYESSLAPVFVDLYAAQFSGGDAEGDVITAVENIVGTPHNDQIIGNNTFNVLNGGEGDDWLDGGSAADTLIGGAGNDHIIAGLGDDLIVWGVGQGSDVFADFESGDVVQIEGLATDGVFVFEADQPNSYAILSKDTKELLTIYAKDGDAANLGSILFEDGTTWNGTDLADRAWQDVFDGLGALDVLYVSDADIDENGKVLNTAPISVGVAIENVAMSLDLHASNFDQFFASDYSDVLDVSGSRESSHVFGRGGNDTLLGGIGADYLYGEAGDDVITGYNEDDVLFGGTGADSINGDGGDDTVDGGGGTDILSGNTGDDLVVGGGSTDSLHGDVGDDVLMGGGGNDSLLGGLGDDLLIGPELDLNDSNLFVGDINTLLGAIEAYKLTTYEPLLTGVETDYYEGDLGDDRIIGSGGDEIIFGDVDNTKRAPEGDESSPLPQPDFIHGGDDEVLAGSGDDVVYGGVGDDTLYGQGGNDKLLGEKDDDYISGGDGHDEISGGYGDDTIYGGAGSDLIWGNEGDDFIDGGDGDDIIYYSYGGGDDKINGGDGDDQLYLSGTSQGWDDVRVAVKLSAQYSDWKLYDVYELSRAEQEVAFDVIYILGQTFTLELTGFVKDDIKAHQIGGMVWDHDAFTLDYREIHFDSDNANDVINESNAHLYNGSATYLRGRHGSDSLSITDQYSSGDEITLDGGTGDDVVIGSYQDDTLLGRWGSDVLDGGEGSDVINGDSGEDDISGGNGDDTISSGSGDDQADGGEGSDTIVGYEGDDQIYGGGGGDTAVGGSGRDTIYGGSGDDVLSGTDGRDKIYGDLQENADPNSNIDISAGSDEINGGAGADLIIGNGNNPDPMVQEKLSGGGGDDIIYGDDGTYDENGNYVGASGDDFIYGNDGDDQLYGEDGEDTIDGGGGADRISGGEGDDVIDGRYGADRIFGEAGDDQLAGYYGNDRIEGGDGADTISGGSGSDRLFGELESGPNAFTSNDIITGDGGHDHIEGGAGDDQLDGGIDNDRVLGGDGNDTVLGGAGNDTLSGGAGNDVIDGGAGMDIVMYDDATASVEIDLSEQAIKTDIVISADLSASGDHLSNIEGVRGGAYADILTGDGADNILFGGGSNDELRGGAGDDQLIGYDGNDKLYGDVGADYLDGGRGVDDSVWYTNSAEGVTVDLLTGIGVGGDADGDRLRNIENFYGSAFSDLVIGRQGADHYFSGLNGDDTLVGNNGFDVLNGGNGDDVLDGGTNADLLNGGSGNDTASYAVGGAGVLVNLASGIGYHVTESSLQDTLTFIENVSGSDYNDSITGDDSANVLTGLAGDDYLGGGLGDDRLLGGAGDDDLRANDGDDWLDGGAGSDVINGHGGNDTVSYASSVGAVSVDLSTYSATEADGSTDTLYNLENVEGTAFDDTILGNSLANILVGGAGSDNLTGGAGADIFAFATDSGADVISDFEDGVDVIDLTTFEINDGVAIAFAELTISDDATGATVQLGASATNTVLLAGVTAAQIAADDFILA